LVLPGRSYYITVGVAGSIPASPSYPYAVQLSIGGPGAPMCPCSRLTRSS